MSNNVQSELFKPGSLNEFTQNYGHEYKSKEELLNGYFGALAVYRTKLAEANGVDLEDLHRYKFGSL